MSVCQCVWKWRCFCVWNAPHCGYFISAIHSNSSQEITELNSSRYPTSRIKLWMWWTLNALMLLPNYVAYLWRVQTKMIVNDEWYLCCSPIMLLIYGAFNSVCAGVILLSMIGYWSYSDAEVLSVTNQPILPNACANWEVILQLCLVLLKANTRQLEMRENLKFQRRNWGWNS
jgi:hypothetical protein